MLVATYFLHHAHSYGRAENNAYFCQIEVAERFSRDPGKIQNHQNCCVPTDLPPPFPNMLLQKIPWLALISAGSVNNYSMRSWGLAYIQALCLPAHANCSPSVCSIISSLSLHASWTWSLLCLMTVISSIECLCCINVWSPLQSQLVWQALIHRLSSRSWGPPACTLPSLQFCRGPTLWIPLEDAMCQAHPWNSGFCSLSCAQRCLSAFSVLTSGISAELWLCSSVYSINLKTKFSTYFWQVISDSSMWSVPLLTCKTVI